ncbi:phenylacetic acid degradation operon negative regulatory protein PaaX [Undibacterium sp. CY18W]|uniref:Phenylacetic acid degradation operon negative regulatory protein PaaX n=1 Tax=Undibacterium hunanense TaxID=2762292 RepID=A0ABR6ZVF8_9BURK|nr:phenylacetic acid degradation operon negative regulatory protein PaaX [Undibacterium hunanense]MBC3919500.1 phenylacetic acid degradation operon negative regulatory protein PaaX [Undibacterium hunanense]
MRNEAKIQDWIELSIARDPPRAKSLVMTVFGDAIAPHGGSIWLGELITLMGHFGISDRLVRTSVFRLTDEGWLEAQRDGRRSSYQLATATYARFQHAYKRVYTQQSPVWDKHWTLLIASNSDAGSGNKNQLKKELSWEGFRQINTGVFAHPQADRVALQDILDRTGYRNQLLICSARDDEQLHGLPLHSLIKSHWQLDEVNASYQKFIDNFSPLLKLISNQDLQAPAAFVIRSLLIHNFRRTQLHDPHLPAELRPADWAGSKAYQLCRAVYQCCYQQAEQLLSVALDGSSNASSTGPAATDLQQRFAN